MGWLFGIQASLGNEIEKRSAMQSFVYDALPARVVFGSGTITQLRAEAERLGVCRALVLSTPGKGRGTSL